MLDRFSPDRAVDKPIGLVEPLSEREIEVLKLVAEGLSNQEIAVRLYLSLRTIKFHTGNIYGKLGVKSRTEAVAKAHALGLLSSSAVVLSYRTVPRLYFCPFPSVPLACYT